MKKINIILLLMALIFNVIYSQQTFSKILDIEESEQEFGTHLRVVDGQIFGFGTHFCPTATIDNRVCASISKFNFDGDFLGINFLEGSENYIGSVSLLDEDSILFLAFDQNLNKHGISLAKFNEQNSQFRKFNVGLHGNRRFVAEGIKEFNNSYYTYGHFDDLTPNVRIQGFIKKWNKDFSEELASWTFEHNEFLTMSDLHFTQDSSIIFSLNESRPGADHNINVHSIQIDTLGNIIKDFEFEYGRVSAGRLLNLELDSQDFAYLSYEKFGDQLLAKIDFENDTILWELVFPSDIHHLARKYQINEIIVSEKEDIVVCGDISYRHFENGEILDVVHSGFISRVSKEGEILWLKILTHEITQPSTLLFAESYLNDIVELSNGNLAGIGQIADLGYNGINQEIWIVSLDENGCIQNFNCEDDIYVLNTNESYPILSSAHELPKMDFIIYPNPIYDKLYLDTPDQNWQYQIFNLQGQQVMQGEYQDYIQVVTLSSGIYFLQLQQNGNYYQSIKFVKE